MPPRFAYWTIIVGGGPTAFRAARPEELVPTLKQLQRAHPDAVMKWFQAARLWDSPEAARGAMRQQRARAGERRARDWRPGGAHADPRERFKPPRDVRRRRLAKRQGWRRDPGPPPGAPVNDSEQGKAPTPRQPVTRRKPPTGRPPSRGAYRPRGSDGRGGKPGRGGRGGGRR